LLSRLILFVRRGFLFILFILTLNLVFLGLKYSRGFYICIGIVFDKLSFLIVFLLLWLIIFLYILGLKYNNNGKDLYNKFLLFLGVTLLLRFSIRDLIGFYMFFELSLVPLIAIIYGWGYQVERIQAAFYLFIYTIVGSLPLLFVFLFFFGDITLVWRTFTFSYSISSFFYLYLLVFLSFRFFIKLPLYGLHLWLPKAHVEAPVSGSIILAAVLLKLRAYGFYRAVFILDSLFKMNYYYLLVLLLYGSFLRRVVAIRQSDLKSLIAYSSISHMGVILGGVLCLSSMSNKGAFVIILGHGFCSSALFFLVNFQYERSYSRQLLSLSGQIRFFLNVAFWWFMFLIINFSAPPFLNLFGEILVIAQIYFLNFMFVPVFILVGFMVAYFCIFVFRQISHGKVSSHLFLLGFTDFQHLLLLCHGLPIILLVFKIERVWFYKIILE